LNGPLAGGSERLFRYCPRRANCRRSNRGDVHHRETRQMPLSKASADAPRSAHELARNRSAAILFMNRKRCSLRLHFPAALPDFACHSSISPWTAFMFSWLSWERVQLNFAMSVIWPRPPVCLECICLPRGFLRIVFGGPATWGRPPLLHVYAAACRSHISKVQFAHPRRSALPVPVRWKRGRGDLPAPAAHRHTIFVPGRLSSLALVQWPGNERCWGKSIFSK